MRFSIFKPYIYHYGLVLISGLFLVGCYHEKDRHPNEYKEFLSIVYDQDQFNGNVLIVENGNLEYQGSYGISNIDPVQSLDLNSVFRLGSVSKQFTAMAIMKLKELGKLSYDQDIRDYIPELPYEGITIKHLLNHVSGLPDYVTLMDANWKHELEVDDPERFISGNEDIIKMLAEKMPDIRFNPGEKWEYSNTGYVLLAAMVERASGNTFRQFLHDQIFDPVGMTSTSVYKYVAGKDESMPLRVYGYSAGLNGTDLKLDDVHYLNPVQGDGGIYSTMSDLMKWDRELYTEALVSKETLDEAFTPAILNDGDTTNYGFGWFINESPSGGKVVEHTGGWVGFRTYIYREIEEKNCVIILTNHSSRYLNGISAQLKNILHDKPYHIPPLAIGETMGKIVLSQGVEAAIDHYLKLKSDSVEKYDFSKDQLFNLGYLLIQSDRTSDAIKILELSQKEYPQPASFFNGIGDYLLANGDTTHALICYKNALAIDTTFAPPRKKIEDIQSSTVSN